MHIFPFLFWLLTRCFNIATKKISTAQVAMGDFHCHVFKIVWLFVPQNFSEKEKQISLKIYLK